MILAAIDIGSNAARLLISEVVKHDKEIEFNKLNLIRIPLRLGFDVFEKGYIGFRKKKMLINTIDAFSALMKVYEVDHYIACATSAMRDASNSKEIIKEIKAETGIKLEVISGDLEAEIIYENHIAELLDANKSYLYIDVGGGSTEVTLFHKSAVAFQKSFNIGTVRILTNKVEDATWEDLKQTLKEIGRTYPKLVAIGSGGNINKIYSMINSKNIKSIPIEVIREFHRVLEPMTVEERMHTYLLKRDRADVIVPALNIYAYTMKWANIDEIYVPKIGLADGLINHLYEQVK
ncbi:MAG: exopolyphosphatase [Chitinophagaceae bacterium]|nr:exopolyphosphatase [Chitinophagaceae bacterium]MCF8422568.1 exopolyphosphatase [Chitinophagaceae bacterium]